MLCLTKNKKLIGAFAFSFLLNALMLFRNLGIDENSTVFLSSLPFWDLVAHEKGSSILYFSLVSLFPSNPLFAARFLSLIFSLCAVYVFYLIVREIASEKIAYSSSLLLIFNPLFFLFSHHARVYSLFVFLFLVSIYFLQRKDYLKLLFANLLFLPSHLVSFLYLILQSFYLFFSAFSRKHFSFIREKFSFSRNNFFVEEDSFFSTPRKSFAPEKLFFAIAGLILLFGYFSIFVSPYSSQLPLQKNGGLLSIPYLFYKFFALPNLSELGLALPFFLLIIFYLYFLIIKKSLLQIFFNKFLFFMPKKEDLFSKFSISLFLLHLVAGLIFPTLLYFRYFVYFIPFLSFSLAKALENKPKIFYAVLLYFILNILYYAFVSYSFLEWGLLIAH